MAFLRDLPYLPFSAIIEQTPAQTCAGFLQPFKDTGRERKENEEVRQ